MDLIQAFDDKYIYMFVVINTLIDKKNNVFFQKKCKQPLLRLLECSEEHFVNEFELLKISGYPFIKK